VFHLSGTYPSTCSSWDSSYATVDMALRVIGAHKPHHHDKVETQGVISPGEKRPGLEADNSPPSCTTVKNGGVIPPFPVRHHGVVLN
jgi:hypothetical protein